MAAALSLDLSVLSDVGVQVPPPLPGFAGLVEMADTAASKTADKGHKGSTPLTGTKVLEMWQSGLLHSTANAECP